MAEVEIKVKITPIAIIYVLGKCLMLLISEVNGKKRLRIAYNSGLEAVT